MINLQILDWTGLDWTGLDWTGLDWTRLNWVSFALENICTNARKW